MQPRILIPLAILGVIGFVAGTAKARPSDKPETWTGEPRDVARAVAEAIESRYATLPGLADFIDAVGYWESRWHAGAYNPIVDATGMHQIIPGAAFPWNEPSLVDKRSQFREILVIPEKSTVLATNHVVRGARSVLDKGGSPDWLSIRRWWRKPSLANDVQESDSESVSVREHFSKALEAVGLPQSFMYEKVDVDGYPGIDTILRDLEIDL